MAKGRPFVTIAGEVFAAEAAYWTGYLYRCWHVLAGEPSARIYRQAPAEVMRRSST